MQTMFRVRAIQCFSIGHFLAVAPAFVFAQGSDTGSFADLLAVARTFAGSATFVDAERFETSDRAALKFLFRRESGKLVSVVLDAETAEIVDERRAPPGRVAASQQTGRPTPSSENEETRDGNERQPRSSSQATDGTERHRDNRASSDNGAGRGRDSDRGRGSGNRSGRE